MNSFVSELRSLCGLVGALIVLASCAPVHAGDSSTRRVAAIVTEYRHNSHADLFVSRLLLTDMLDGTGRDSPLELVSLYTDQRPPNDISRLLAASHRFSIKPTIAGALMPGSDHLAVDGILLIAEHGDYPFSATGNHQFPKRRFWEEVLKVFRKSGRVVPVFADKHLSDNWADAKFIYDSARELKIPLMAGSSLPVAWRYPAADVARGERVTEIVALTYHTTDSYGFHGLEAVQALAEQRKGGETGVRSVQCLLGNAVWKAIDERLVDPDLLAAALRCEPRYAKGGTIDRKAVREPKLMKVDYVDGLRVFLLEVNDQVGNWTAAWRSEKNRKVESTLFWTQEERPGAHFTLLLHEIEKMMLSREPPWPVERTLLTTGVLDALLQSKKAGMAEIPTPYLRICYQPTWRWKQPPPPPPGRPWNEQ